MINVNIVTFGKLKESYLREASDEYKKRLQSFCKLKIVELAPIKMSENPSEKEISTALASEAKMLTPYISEKNAVNIAMCIEGKQISSEELSEKIENYGVSGNSTVNFFIGSSHGISEEIKQKCQLKLSMSKMTFPHQLARVMLLEQIYRAFSISNGSKYHK